MGKKYGAPQRALCFNENNRKRDQRITGRRYCSGLQRIPNGEAINRVEAPRGELFYYAKGNKTQILERLKIKAPTFSNVPSMVHGFKNNEYASAPAIIGSYDPCLSCTSR